jgi:capsular exopolysaccharide synthesis family protein
MSAAFELPEHQNPNGQRSIVPAGNITELSAPFLGETRLESLDISRVATIPLPDPPHPRLAVLRDDFNVAAEKFRALAARLRHLQRHRKITRLLVTSSIKGEGKSVVSANLAISLARRQRVLLIDGDLRQSGLQDLLNTHGLRGLTDWWQREGLASDFICRIEGLSLWCMPCGLSPEEPLDILQSQRLADVLNQLVDSFEWIVIDSPPLVPLVDAQNWAAHADATLLVVRQGRTPKKLLKKALDSVENLKLLGAVMNDYRETEHPYYQRYYAQGYGNNPALQSSSERATRASA